MQTQTYSGIVSGDGPREYQITGVRAERLPALRDRIARSGGRLFIPGLDGPPTAEPAPVDPIQPTGPALTSRQIRNRRRNTTNQLRTAFNRPVKCLTSGVNYPNAAQAARAERVSQSELSKHLRGIAPANVHGLIFQYRSAGAVTV